MSSSSSSKQCPRRSNLPPKNRHRLAFAKPSWPSGWSSCDMILIPMPMTTPNNCGWTFKMHHQETYQKKTIWGKVWDIIWARGKDLAKPQNTSQILDLWTRKQFLISPFLSGCLNHKSPSPLWNDLKTPSKVKRLILCQKECWCYNHTGEKNIIPIQVSVYELLLYVFLGGSSIILCA